MERIHVYLTQSTVNASKGQPRQEGRGQKEEKEATFLT